MEAQVNEAPLPLRSYTILGVCQAIGEDFGFNPNYIRVPLAATVLYSPLWAFAAYFVLGAIVLLSRVLFPQKTEKVAPAAEAREASNQQVELAKAA